MDETRYEYIDGNGNRYVVTPSILQYIPVVPSESSSGTYSGGEKKMISLHEVQFQAIRKVLQDAIENREIHIDKRIMGSGLIRFESGAASESVVIRPDALEKSRIESLLGEFLLPAK